MTPREQGFLLLTSSLGDPERKPLTTAQLRILQTRGAMMEKPRENRELELQDLADLGYSREQAQHILRLLDQEVLLQRYLRDGQKRGCAPITLASPKYPRVLREKLGMESPGCLWLKGDLSLLTRPKIALVGSRELAGGNARFAELAGRMAARQGFTLVSGNARGADQTAQESCLFHGGSVISVVAGELYDRMPRDNVLYISEDGYDEAFSPQRAHSRNRIIHSLGEVTLVAQSSLRTGGTWAGTVKNLRHGWSPVCCFADGSEAAQALADLGARLVDMEALSDLSLLTASDPSLFE